MNIDCKEELFDVAVTWSAGLYDLIILLAGLYPDRDRARLVVIGSGFDPDEIDLAGSSKVFWMRVVEEANRRRMVDNVIDIARKEFPNVNFAVLKQRLDNPVDNPEPEFSEDRWNSSKSGHDLEAITGKQSTLKPIAFLELGLLRARSVARVQSPKACGTGFLTHNDIFITNNHVISNAADARGSKIWFNYQKTVAGKDGEVAEFTLDPDSLFETSPADGGDDWTIIRIKGNPNACWGALDVSANTVGMNDFVSIIQHPGGMSKQIAIYHNAVVFVDLGRVQYMTDTMPGSSGSPVFDDDWNVVAMHHSGGWLPEPGSNKVFFRNEGIHIRVLVDALKGLGV